jgi:hypothetical protein
VSSETHYDFIYYRTGKVVKYALGEAKKVEKIGDFTPLKGFQATNINLHH